MTDTPAIKSVGIIGGGLIGMSWTALFLAKGLDVRVTDPVGKAEDNLRAFVAEVWPKLETLGLVQGASQDRLFFSTEIGVALDGVDFVQENGPERVELKRDIIRSVSEAVRNDVIIASSSSGLMPSTFQDAAVNPGRVLIGHPFNPPHLVPLVEIVGGKLTDETSIAQAISFYKAMGKRPVRLRKEMKGHIANRLQAAILREVFHLVAEDVASIADIDAALSQGPGLRWAILGQFLNSDLGGGEGGFAAFANHLGPAVEDWWTDLGAERKIAPETVAAVIEGLKQEAATHGRTEIEQARDDVLLGIIKAKAARAALPE